MLNTRLSRVTGRVASRLIARDLCDVMPGCLGSTVDCAYASFTRAAYDHHGVYPWKKIRKYSMLGVPNPGPLIRHETHMTSMN